MAASAFSPTAAASALAAFIRGVERRALVVAELQTGDALVAERAVAAATRAFATHAAKLPMPEWPARFWSLLCSTPQFLEADSGGVWSPSLEHLRGMAPAERLALLLRIGAGLDEAEASAVLGVDIADYRQALAGACPLDLQGHPDAAAWRALAEAVQEQIRDLSPVRQAQLNQLRETVLNGSAPGATGSAPATTIGDAPPAAAAGKRKRGPGMHDRRYLRWLIPLLVLAAAVGIWAWWAAARLPAADVPAQDGLSLVNPVQVEELPAEEMAPAPAGNDPHVATDLAMLADPELGIARDANFYAWFSAGGPVPVDESQARPSTPEPAAAGLETVESDG